MSIIYLSTRSKKTRKQKQKQKDAWDLYKEKYGLSDNKGRTQQIVKAWAEPKLMSIRPGALDHQQHKSLNSGAAVATKTARPIYTGDQMIGIAAMHKSNLVPIFSSESAHDVAKMRRG